MEMSLRANDRPAGPRRPVGPTRLGALGRTEGRGPKMQNPQSPPVD